MNGVNQINNFNLISYTDLEEDCVIMMENGLVLKFIGQVDIRTNRDFLFKTIYSPFATTKWMELTPEKIHKLRVVNLIKA